MSDEKEHVIHKNFLVEDEREERREALVPLDLQPGRIHQVRFHSPVIAVRRVQRDGMDWEMKFILRDGTVMYADVPGFDEYSATAGSSAQ
jgi:hypothetical protein